MVEIQNLAYRQKANTRHPHLLANGFSNSMSELVSTVNGETPNGLLGAVVDRLSDNLRPPAVTIAEGKIFLSFSLGLSHLSALLTIK